LLRNEVITPEEYEECLQDKDIIQLELNKGNIIELELGGSDIHTRIQKLKFFHTWIFYYFYCADHKFIKHIFKGKFTFVQTLFGKELKLIKKRAMQNIRDVYSPNLKKNEDF
jgi:hypothetical protein